MAAAEVKPRWPVPRWPALPALPVRLPLRLRVVFRGMFALLALATLGLALSVLQDEKQRSHRVYADGLAKNQAQIAARLRHPTGQLALLNPGTADRPAQPLRPIVLPYAALDFDDRAKALQAVELSGCALQYPGGATLCAAVGSNPYAGGFVYLVGSLAAGSLVPHLAGDLALDGVHRAQVEVAWRGQTSRWIAPYELLPEARPGNQGAGRLTGHAGDAPLAAGARPVRDFRGWLWQEGRCLEPGAGTPAATTPAAATPGCLRRSFLSVRLPVDVLRDALAAGNPVWPPPDLDGMRIRLRLLAPGDAPPLFDSDTPGAVRPFSLGELRALLLPGERLLVRRGGADAPLFSLTGAAPAQGPVAPWIAQLIRRLPVEGFDTPLVVRERIDTALGRVDLELQGDLRGVNTALAAVATRLVWTVGAMLLAIGLTWAVIELFLIRRITLLTRRAAAVSLGVRGGGAVGIDLTDLRGGDELAVLARGLNDLLQRVNDDVRREQIRARQEQDQWHAVGHEIMSPLQSLMALHGAPGDPSGRYIARMQQAVRVLYGQASPSEAFAATTLAVGTLDLDAFLGHVADNAGYIGIDGVVYRRAGAPVVVRADEHSLEDVVGHVLRNAARHRLAGTPITLALQRPEAADTTVQVDIHNQGPAIAGDMLERIFEYGVSDAPDTAAPGRRGQGLFVARTYMAKMGGTVSAANVDGGVVFRLVLQRAPG